jgi:transposase InsO family protein
LIIINLLQLGYITYCWTEEVWLYLAVVMDLYSRKIVGWAISERMTKQLVIDALQMAIWSRKPPKGFIRQRQSILLASLSTAFNATRIDL